MTRETFGLSAKMRDELIRRFIGQPAREAHATPQPNPSANTQEVRIPEAHYRFDRHPGYERLLIPKRASERFGVANPFYRLHDGVAGATSSIQGRMVINFTNYNYLGLAGHPRVNDAAKRAVEQYGTSASAARLGGGERQIQRELEGELARLYGVDDCMVFVSGHTTNVSTIGQLFGPKDLVLHDSLAHNSVIEGIRLSGAARRSFPHNDAAAVDALLRGIRGQFERVLIVTEGLFGMDGDISTLPELIEIKRRHKAFLMVDEAHSLGVVGNSGRGLREHYGVAGEDVDIWMGTLSKTLAGCGGFIAGEHALVEHLRYAAPGFVYSAGIAPVLAAASLEALKVMLEEPVRVMQLRARSQKLLSLLDGHGIDTGRAEGYAVIPVILGSSLRAIILSNQLLERGINVQPIVYPGVEERAARLRFFVCSEHSEAQLEAAVDTLAELLSRGGGMPSL